MMKHSMPLRRMIVSVCAFVLFAATLAPAFAQQTFRLATGWASPSGYLRGSTDGSVADMTALVGNEEVYVTPILPSGSVFVADFEGVSIGALDSVYFKTKELLLFAPAGGVSKGTLRIELPPESLAESYLPITLYSGDGESRYSPYIPFNAYDYDDFSIRNIRIETPDGRTLQPSSMVGYYGHDLTAFKPYDEEKTYEFGNGGPDAWDDSKILMAVFAFEMDPAFAREFEIDVSGLSLKEGKALVDIIKDGKKAASLPFAVDATAPIIGIVAPARASSLLRGRISLAATAVDAGSGNSRLSASLDGKTVSLPFEFLAADLPLGNHEFVVTASDAVGNQSRTSYAFKTVEENPALPLIEMPHKGSVGQATIRVSDPQKDELEVLVRRGWRLTTADGSVIALADVYPRDPPLTIEGLTETFLDAKALAAADGQSAETSAITGFPGHRFEVSIPQALIDSIKITWEGSTLPGRFISAWTWDFINKSWTWSASGSSGPLAWNLDPKRQVQADKAQILLLDPINSPFTVAWMSDPQYYAESFPAIYGKLADWLVEGYRSGDISYVVDTGDIVNKSLERRQWIVADKSMRILDDAGMPYGAISGNHDIQHDQKVYDAYLYYFGEKRFAGDLHRGGSWKGGIHHYDLLSFGAYDFIFLFIGNGYETDVEGLAWADGILKTYPDRTAVVSTHYYLNANGTRSTGGKAIYDNLVVPNDNVQLVLCGHIHGVATVKQRIRRADGSFRQVTEMLADYQSNPFGGEGYLRLLTFDPAKAKLSVRTYSPWLDKWNSFGQAKDEFDLEFEFPAPVKELSTDYFVAEVFGTTTLATYGLKPSGSILKVDVPETGWYAQVRDGFGGVSKSAVMMPGPIAP